MMFELKSYALDEQFGGQMNSRAERSMLESDDGKRRRIKLSTHLVRVIVRFMGQFCRVDLYGGHQLSKVEASKKYWHGKEPKFKENFDQKYSSVQPGAWWPSACMVLFVYSLIRLNINIYYQYVYDYQNLKYQRFLAIPALEFKAGAAFKRVLLEKLRLSRDNLKSIGAPYMEAHFAFEIFVIFAMLLSYTLFFYNQFYFSKLKPFEFGLIRSILDLRAELRVCNRMIREEVNRFLESSRVFTLNLIETIQESAVQQHRSCIQVQCKDDSLKLQIEYQGQLQRSLMNHGLVIKQMEHMALDGSLLPCNRSFDWIGTVSYYHCLFSICFNIYCLVLQISIAIAFPTLIGIPLEMDLMDLVGMVDLLIIIVTVVITSTFYGTLIFASCIDQVYIANRVKWSINKCIRVNEKRFYACLVLLKHLNTGQERTSNSSEAMISRRFLNKSAVYHCDSLNSGSRASLMHRSGSGFELLRLAKIEEGRSKESGIVTMEQCRWSFKLSPPLDTDPDGWSGIPPMCDDHLSPRAEATLGESTADGKSLAEHEQESMFNIEIESCFTQMNANLLHVLMQYKIFVTQLHKTKQSFDFLTPTTAILLVVMPLVGRLHVPYVDPRVTNYVALASVLCTLAADMFILIPITYLYSRCLELYKAQSSLLAHAISITSYAELCCPNRISISHHVYDRHAVWLIRKELHHPDQFIDQFVTTLLGIPIKYENLLSSHFWVGIIIISLFIDSSASAHQRDLLSVLFVDPLGIF